MRTLYVNADAPLVDVLCDASCMSVVKINAVTVPEGMGDDFMERFAKRAGSVESQPGFEEFLLLKPTDGASPFYVFTRWESEEAFEEWMGGSDFRRAHGTDGEASAEALPKREPHLRLDLPNKEGSACQIRKAAPASKIRQHPPPSSLSV